MVKSRKQALKRLDIDLLTPKAVFQDNGVKFYATVGLS